MYKSFAHFSFLLSGFTHWHLKFFINILGLVHYRLCVLWLSSLTRWPVFSLSLLCLLRKEVSNFNVVKLIIFFFYYKGICLSRNLSLSEVHDSILYYCLKASEFSFRGFFNPWDWFLCITWHWDPISFIFHPKWIAN